MVTVDSSRMGEVGVREPERMDSAGAGAGTGNEEGLDVVVGVESESGSGPKVGVGAGKEGGAKSMKGDGRVLRFWYWPEVLVGVGGGGGGPVVLGHKASSLNSWSGFGNSGTVGVKIGKKAADVARLGGNDIDGSGSGSGSISSGFRTFIIVSKPGTLWEEEEGGGSGPKMSLIEAAMKFVYSASSMNCGGVPVIIIFILFSSSFSPVMLPPPPAPPSWLALMVLVAYAGGSDVVVVIGTLKSRLVVPWASPGGGKGELVFTGSVLLVFLWGETFCCWR